jgi:hypothetical protein
MSRSSLSNSYLLVQVQEQVIQQVSQDKRRSRLSNSYLLVQVQEKAI